MRIQSYDEESILKLWGPEMVTQSQQLIRQSVFFTEYATQGETASTPVYSSLFFSPLPSSYAVWLDGFTSTLLPPHV